MLHRMTDGWRRWRRRFRATTLSRASKTKPDLVRNFRVDNNFRHRRNNRTRRSRSRLFRNDDAFFLCVVNTSVCETHFLSWVRFLVSLALHTFSDLNERNSQIFFQIGKVDSFADVRTRRIGSDVWADNENRIIQFVVGRIAAVIVARKFLFTHFLSVRNFFLMVIFKNLKMKTSRFMI